MPVNEENALISKKHIRSAIYTVLVAVLIYLSFTFYVGADKMLAAIKGFPIVEYLIPVLLLIILGSYPRIQMALLPSLCSTSQSTIPNIYMGLSCKLCLNCYTWKGWRDSKGCIP